MSAYGSQEAMRPSKPFTKARSSHSGVTATRRQKNHCGQHILPKSRRLQRMCTLQSCNTPKVAFGVPSQNLESAECSQWHHHHSLTVSAGEDTDFRNLCTLSAHTRQRTIAAGASNRFFETKSKEQPGRSLRCPHNAVSRCTLTF